MLTAQLNGPVAGWLRATGQQGRWGRQREESDLQIAEQEPPIEALQAMADEIIERLEAEGHHPDDCADVVVNWFNGLDRPRDVLDVPTSDQRWARMRAHFEDALVEMAEARALRAELRRYRHRYRRLRAAYERAQAERRDRRERDGLSAELELPLPVMMYNDAFRDLVEGDTDDVTLDADIAKLMGGLFRAMARHIKVVRASLAKLIRDDAKAEGLAPVTDQDLLARASSVFLVRSLPEWAAR